MRFNNNINSRFLFTISVNYFQSQTHLVVRGKLASARHHDGLFLSLSLGNASPFIPFEGKKKKIEGTRRRTYRYRAETDSTCVKRTRYIYVCVPPGEN